jgi:transposase InsO family protein
MLEKPDWSNQQYADACGRCKSWVKKWKKRLRGTALDDEAGLHSQSRARKTPPEPYHPEVIERILELRDQPPAEVPRKIGPRTILYYLHHDKVLAARQRRLPRSTGTIWKILDHHQRIVRQAKVESLPFDRPEPMDTWEIDFTDVSGAQALHDRKQVHQVEAFAVVDRGTSILVDLQVSDDYQAQTALVAMASTLIQQGLPKRIVFDRDPRFVGSWSADDFPSAFMRFLMCLGIEVEVCPPQRPDLKPFVERYFRTLNSECVRVQLPANAKQARDIFDRHRFTYNHERPHQSKVCCNLPPYKAFTQLPRLPHISETIDPNHWLTHYHNRLYKRRVDHSGRVQIDKHRYYIQRSLAGRYVVCKLNADRRVLDVIVEGKTIKTISLKGIYGEPMAVGDYLEMMMREAEAEQQRLACNRRFRVS